MTGKDVIKAILDQGLVDEEIKVVGVVDDGLTVDDTSSVAIEEITSIEMADGETQAAIVVSAALV